MSASQKRLLAPVDAAWLSMDSPENPLVITVLMRVEGLTDEKLLGLLHSHWLSEFRLDQRPVQRAGTWWWEPVEDFSPAAHLESISETLPDGAALEQAVQEAMGRPLPENGPLWECLFLPVADGVHGVLFRVHHCYGDGLSLVRLFERLSSSAADKPAAVPAQSVSDEASGEQNSVDRAWRWAQQQFARLLSGQGVGSDPGQWLDQGVHLAREVSEFLFQPSDSASVLRQPVGGEKLCAWSAGQPLFPLKATARAAGCSLNDLVLAAVTGGLTRYLAEQAETPEMLRAHAAMPVDLRRLMPEPLRPPRDRPANAFGTVFLPLALDAQSPLERLYRTKHETRRMKQSWQPLIAWGLLCAAGYLPWQWQEPLIRLFGQRASLVISNVPGSPTQRYLAGCPVREQLFWVPQAGGMGLGISIMSYAGELRLGIQSDRRVIEQPRLLLDYCLEELSQRLV